MVKVSTGLVYENNDFNEMHSVTNVWWKFLVPEIAKENKWTVLGVFLCKEQCNVNDIMSVTSDDSQLTQLLPNNIQNSKWKNVVQNLMTEPRLYFFEMSYDGFIKMNGSFSQG